MVRKGELRTLYLRRIGSSLGGNMKKFEGERRIYAIVAASIEGQDGRKVVQPIGRQVAQVAHVVSKLRWHEALTPPSVPVWYPITTIILQARDANELQHVYALLRKKKIIPTTFADTNPEYGSGSYITAICTPPVFRTQVEGILDYLPLWGAK